MTGPEKSPDRIATAGDVLAAEHRSEIQAWFSSTAGALVVLLGLCSTLTAGTWFILSTAQAQTASAIDAGVGTMHNELTQHIKANEKSERDSDQRFNRIEAASQRQDLKLDAILIGLHIVNPAPTPTDAGHP